MDAFDDLSPALHVTPRRKELLSVVRGDPLEDRIFLLTLRNLRGHAVLPLFAISESFVGIGPHGVVIDERPVTLADGREQWKSLEPLESRASRDYEVYLDTQSSSFPLPGRNIPSILLDLFVEEHGLLTPAGSVPIVLREVLAEKEAYTGIVALDFGTTNTCVVTSPHDQWLPRVVQMGGVVNNGNEEVPSLIAYNDVADPALPLYAVGGEAKLLLGQPGGDEVISSIKRYVTSGTKFFVGSSRDAQPVYFRAPEVAGHIVATIRKGIERHLGQKAVVELTCTYPTAFSKAQIGALESVFEQVQQDVAERYKQDIQPVRMLLDEATAAALFYLHHRFGGMQELRAHLSSDDFSVLCYDLGGGTTDISLTRFRFETNTPKRAAVAIDSDLALEEVPLTDLSSLIPEVQAPAQPKTAVRGRIAQRDGLDAFGGDNMTLSVFRILKARYALVLAKLVLSGDMDSFSLDDALGLRNAAEFVTSNQKILERWTRRGDPAPADTGVSYGGYLGVVVPPEVWDAIDVIVPTRFHEGYNHEGHARDARHDIFYDLWQTAETAKIEFGTPDEAGEYPVMGEPIPPATLLDRYQIGPARLPVRLTIAELRAHVEPSLMLSFAKVKAMLREENLISADFFVLAGNACKLPLIRELFTTQLSPFGAVEDWNVLFDPAVAKTAVARGAALYAVNLAGPDGGAWTLEEEGGGLLEHIGVLASQNVFADAAEPLHRWFERGSPLPARARIRLQNRLPSLKVYATRRLGSAPRHLGSFMFLREYGRVPWTALEGDLKEAIKELSIDKGGDVEEDGTYVGDIVITGRQRLFLQRDRTWYALWPSKVGLPDHLSPFSGKQ